MVDIEQRKTRAERIASQYRHLLKGWTAPRSDSAPDWENHCIRNGCGVTIAINKQTGDLGWGGGRFKSECKGK